MSFSNMGGPPRAKLRMRLRTEEEEGFSLSSSSIDILFSELSTQESSSEPVVRSTDTRKVTKKGYHFSMSIFTNLGTLLFTLKLFH